MQNEKYVPQKETPIIPRLDNSLPNISINASFRSVADDMDAKLVNLNVSRLSSIPGMKPMKSRIKLTKSKLDVDNIS